ncbi:MAG: VWA domain-containing protein [Anaerolineae bacterium]|nr:VWA domain-containing protein [Anaerolineae bacterium]
MGIRAQSLERALPAITSFITERTNIPIVRADRAATDGNVIYLPRLPELDLEERDVVKTVAWIYHENGHIKHSDFSLSGNTPLERAIAGVLEDIRIEGLVMRTFPAARRYLCRMVDILVEDGEAGKYPCFKPALEGATEAEVLQYYMLYKLRHDVLSQRGVAPVLEPTAKVAEARFPVGMKTRLDALMYEVVNCESEREVFDLTAAIIKMIKEEKEKEEDKERERKQRESSSGAGNGQPQAGAGDPSQGESSGESGGETGEQGDTQSTANSSGEGGQQAGEPEQSESSSGAGGNGAGGAKALEELLSMVDDQVAQDVGEMLEQAINQAAAKAEWTRKSVAMPNVHPMKLRRSAVDMNKIRASINAIRTKTLNWMSSASETDKLHSRAGVMLDFSRLHAVPFGGDVFVRESEGIDLNAAVSVLIDRSGSMQSEIQQAAYAAMATMLAFDVPGIETQVSVFPTCVGGEEGVGVIKRWQEAPRDLASRIASLTTDGGTPMSEAMLWAAADLVRREETLRIVVVVTDGQPNNLESAKDVVARARADSIAVVGLGIGVDPSGVFGEKHSAALTDINELSGAMVKLIKASMAEARQQ